VRRRRKRRRWKRNLEIKLRLAKRNNLLVLAVLIESEPLNGEGVSKENGKEKAIEKEKRKEQISSREDE